MIGNYNVKVREIECMQEKESLSTLKVMRRGQQG